MEQKRAKRLKIEMELVISKLFKQDHISIEHVDTPIHVENISKTGIGFSSAGELPVGYYFNAKIALGSKDSSFYTVVKIVRNQSKPDGTYFYGCEFVGIAPVLDYIFREYNPALEEME